MVMIRATNFPVLLVIALWERQTYNQQTLWEQFCDFADHYLGRLTAASECVSKSVLMGSRGLCRLSHRRLCGL